MPSRGLLSRAAVLLALAGLAVAAYLTWVHFDTSALVCGLGDCHTVQSSEFATVGPIPVALLGLGMYATVLICHVAMRTRPDWQTALLLLAFGVTFAGALYAVYLTWLEVAVIGAICQWCVVSAVLTMLLTAIEGGLVWQSLGVSNAGDTETSGGGAAS
jgi:uncharacterized membrane protein